LQPVCENAVVGLISAIAMVENISQDQHLAWFMQGKVREKVVSEE
jgi:hypothetical protein